MSADEFHHRLDDVESRAHRRIDDLQRQVERVGNNAAPTIPTYDSANWPQDAVYGQIVKDVQHNLWVYGEDDKWHVIGGQNVVAPPIQKVSLFDYPDLRWSVAWENLWYDATLPMPTRVYLNNYRDNMFLNARAGHNYIKASANIGRPIGGDFIAGRFLAGPTGSSWVLETGFMEGPDYGKLKLQLAQINDVPGYPGQLPQYEDLNWIDWWNTPVAGSGEVGSSNFDMYLSPALISAYGITQLPWADYDSGTWGFRVGGQPGDIFTGFSDPGGTGARGIPTIDGGPGMYAWSLVVYDKNAASTNYKAGVWALNWLRVDGDRVRFSEPS